MGNTNTTGDVTELPVQFRETDEDTFKGEYYGTFSIEELSKSTPDEVRETLRRHHYDTSNGHHLMNERRAELAVFTSEHPEVMREWLINEDEQQDGLLNRVGYWLAAVEPLDIAYFPECLVGAVCLFLGATEKNSIATQKPHRPIGFERWAENHCPDVMGSAEHELFTLLYRDDFHDRAIHMKLAVDIEQVIEDKPELIIAALPWLSRMPEAVVEGHLVSSAIQHEQVVEALKKQAVDIPFLEERSKGLVLLAERKEGGSLYLWNTDGKIYQRPTSLGSPTSTWINSSDMERSLKSAIRSALANLRKVAGEAEVMLTGALLMALQIRMENLGKLPLLGNNHKLSVQYSAPSQQDEKKNGSDVIILVNIEGKELLTKRAHFAQVKAVNKKHSNPASHTTEASWKLELDQLDVLIENDQTATYWFLGPHGDRDLLVVPVAYLKALAEASKKKKKKPTKSMTVNYKVIRSAAIPFDELLTDLVIGLWLGTTDPEKLKYADASVPNRTPAHILTINLTAVSE